jgi:two-component system, chemotaxis family, protein-glutamate methylesterase/glutaminase
MKKIRVLIVDDSALVRETLRGILSSDPRIEVMGTASDPFQAVTRMLVEAPDVITMDVEMPRMDGLTFLKKIMEQHPIPVVIFAAMEGNGSETAMKALEYGAVDVVDKPSLCIRNGLRGVGAQICDTVFAASQVQVRKVFAATEVIQPKLSADVILARPKKGGMQEVTEKVIAVGASTGGTEAIGHFLTSMPVDCPGIVIAQHMPEGFTAAFAQRLDSLCRIKVREAKSNDAVLPGQALIAPGNRHLLLRRGSGRYFVEINSGPLVTRHRPSVDVLFRSAAHSAGRNVIGVIMTGMGDDGAQGMLELHQSGAYTIAQNEESCVVFGMPQQAIKMGGVVRVLPLGAIAAEVMRSCRECECVGMLA